MDPSRRRRPRSTRRHLTGDAQSPRHTYPPGPVQEENRRRDKKRMPATSSSSRPVGITSRRRRNAAGRSSTKHSKAPGTRAPETCFRYFYLFFFFANKGNHSSSFAVLGGAVERFFGFGPHISVISKHVVATCSGEQNRGSQSPRRAWTSKSASRRRRRPPETRVLRRSIHGSQCVDRSASRSLERHCWSLCGRSIGACILLPRGTPSGRVGRLPPVSSFGHVCRT